MNRSHNSDIKESLFKRLGYTASLLNRFIDYLSCRFFIKGKFIKNIFYSRYISRGNKNAYDQKFEDAIEEYNKALLINPESDYAYLRRGIAKIKLQEFIKAKSDFDSALKKSPRVAIPKRWANPDDLINHPGIFYKSEFDGQSQLLKPKVFSSALFWKGFAEMMLNNHAAAITDFNKVLEIEPNNKEAYYNRGMTRYELKDYIGARSDWNVAGNLGIEKAYEMIKKYCDSPYTALQYLANQIIEQFERLPVLNRNDVKNRWEEFCWNYQGESFEIKLWEDYLTTQIIGTLENFSRNKKLKAWLYTESGQEYFLNEVDVGIDYNSLINSASAKDIPYCEDNIIDEVINLLKEAAECRELDD